MWEEIVSHYKGYVGSGLILVLYFAALIFLFVKEKRKEYRILFVYMPLAVLVIFFGLFMAAVYNKYSDMETYFRFLWLLPVSATLAYTVTLIIMKTQGKKRIASAVFSAVIIMLCGSLIYTSTDYEVAENEFHVPQEVVDICDGIRLNGVQVYAAFPDDMLVYVRQYCPTLSMPYGYDVIKYQSNDTLDALVNSEVVSAEALGTCAQQREVYFIVLDVSHRIEGNLEDYGYSLYKSIDGYDIYRTVNNIYAEYEQPAQY